MWGVAGRNSRPATCHFVFDQIPNINENTSVYRYAHITAINFQQSILVENYEVAFKKAKKLLNDSKLISVFANTKTIRSTKRKEQLLG